MGATPAKQDAAGHINVLLTSVGRRAYLVDYFRQALGSRGLVIATNSSPDVTGMLAADLAYVVPRAEKSEFIDSLLHICANHSVRIMASLHDWEAPYISAHRARFIEIGTIPVVSDPSLTEICLDKWQTYEFLSKLGWHTPASFIRLQEAIDAIQAGHLQFPVIMKPRCGQGSIAIEIVHDLSELQQQHALLLKKLSRMQSNGLAVRDGNQSLLIQEYIDGKQYDLEIVNDFDSKTAGVLSKIKLSSRSGECELAETVDSPHLTELGTLIGTTLKHMGVLDVDVIERDGIYYILEFNPRFGGCYPFSHIAGANLPAAYVAWAQGLPPDPSWLRVQPGIRSFKNFQMIRDQRALEAKGIITGQHPQSAATFKC